MGTKVIVEFSFQKEYKIEELYPGFTEAQIKSLTAMDIVEDFEDPDFFDQQALLELPMHVHVEFQET